MIAWTEVGREQLLESSALSTWWVWKGLLSGEKAVMEKELL